MEDWFQSTIHITASSQTPATEMVALLRARSQFPDRSFSLTACVPQPIAHFDERFDSESEANWRISNWGTERDMSGRRSGEPQVKCSAGVVEISGGTPWDPPIVAFDRLAYEFPHWLIDLEWRERRRRLEGGVVWEDGTRSRVWAKQTPSGDRELELAGVSRLSRHFAWGVCSPVA